MRAHTHMLDIYIYIYIYIYITDEEHHDAYINKCTYGDCDVPDERERGGDVSRNAGDNQELT